MIRIYFIFIIALLVMNLQASSKIINADDFLLMKKKSNNLQNSNKNFSILELKLTMFASEIRTENTLIIKNFPTANGVYSNIFVERSRQIFDQNTKFVTQTPNGEVAIPAPYCDVFKGKIEGENNSEVMILFINNSLFCTINNSDGTRYFLGPYLGNNNEIILVKESDFYQGANFGFNCNSEELKNKISKEIDEKIQSNNLLELEIAIETDTEFFKATGSNLIKAQTYSIALFTMISSIYEKELNITINITWLKCWTDSPADPYSCGGDPFKLRDKAGPYWKANHTDVPRDVFQVITSIPYGGGGYGYLDALCGNKDFGFATSSIQGQHSYPTFTFNYDVYIVAHELGHNFNGQHTHSCYWGYPLDTCLVEEGINSNCLDKSAKPKPNPGSIMSYCGGTNANFGLGNQVRMTFLPQNQSLMRKTAEAASCITEPPMPKIVIKSPNGNEAIEAMKPYDIIFNSVRVNKLNIKFTLDNGVIWRDITSDFNATNGKYTWTAADVCSNNCKIVISSSDDPTVADTTILPFSIYQSKPTDLMAKYYFDGNLQNTICGGFANPLSIDGGVSLTVDRFGLKDSAIALDGKGYLMIPNADLTKNALSVAFWYNPSDLADKKFIIGTNYGPALNVFEIYHWGSLGCSYYMKEGLWQFWGTSGATNTWFHTVFTYDGFTANYYLNGKLSKSENKSGTLLPFNTPIYIGSRKGSEPYKGKLDDIRIYAKALNANEVQEIYTEKRAPQIVTLLNPDDKEVQHVIDYYFSLKWTNPDAPYSYSLQIAKDNTFKGSGLLLDTVLKDTSYNFKAKSLGNYFWRVNATNTFGTSQWTTRSFTLEGFGVNDKDFSKCVILHQNEPNPTSNSVKIKFDLTESTYSELIIHSQLSEILKYNLGNLDSGSHSIDVDLSKYPSGVYFYSLKTKFGTLTKKMEILR